MAKARADADAFDRPSLPPAEAARRLRERELHRLALPTAFVEPAPPLHQDTLWRGLLRQGQARILVVRATQAVTQAAQRLQCSPDVTQLLGELITGTLLLRSTLNPEDRLQVYVAHQGPVGSISVDAWQAGGVRAYIAHPQEERRGFGFLVGAGTLHVARSNPSGRNYSSQVTLDGNSVDEFLMAYLLQSEQILSLLRTDVVVDADGAVAHALGYLVQLMPEGTKDDIACIVKSLETCAPICDGMSEADPDGRTWAAQLLDGFAWDQVAREPVAFLCRCSRDRMISMLSSLPANDIAHLANGAEPLELVCDYCNERYAVRPAELRPLLAKPS